MILFMPKLYKEFECIGSKCKDNCCKTDWDIEIDDDTYNFYKQLKVQQNPDGEKFLSNIEEEDDCRYLKHDGGCSMLNKDGLCSLQLKYGEEHISEICRNHPRFFEWFGGYKECGVGLACEESVRVWLNAEKIEFLYDTDYDEEDDDLYYDHDVLQFAIELRKQFFSVLLDRKKNIFRRMAIILNYTNQIQDDINRNGFKECLKKIDTYKKINFSNFGILREPEYTPEKTLKAIFDELNNMEFLSNGLKDDFKKASASVNEIISSAKQMEKANPEYMKHYENLMIYYIFRWFIKGVRDEDFLGKVKFGFFSVSVIWAMDVFNFISSPKSDDNFHMNIIKEYSKEIEYSYENLEKLFEDFYTDESLSHIGLTALYLEEY